jgi:hypothetical protein
MSLRTGMCGFALLAALAARAGEPATPLENSKLELKALQKGQPAQDGGVSVGKLRDAMPQMRTPGSEVPPPDPLAAEEAEKELKKKKDAQKNWLVNGVESLARNRKSGGHGAKDGLAGTRNENAQSDSSGPASLLKVYSEQQKRAEDRNEAKQASAVHNDPLKPFLQGWLADTPARGKFFDENARKPDATAGFSDPTTQAPLEYGTSSVLAGFDPGGRAPSERGAAAPVQANPYLQGLDMSVLQNTGTRHAQATAVPAFQPAPTPAALPLPGPAPVARQSEKKPFPPALADDKKYFPQLKKF